jgi:TonB family protein
MSKVLFSILITSMLAFAFDSFAIAQSSTHGGAGEKCRGRIYGPKQVSQRPKISSKPSPDFTAAARVHDVRGRVLLSAVLCRTGRVTDIQVVNGLPFGMTEKAIEAARQIEFQPAEKNGQRVSEVFKLEYDFSYVGDRRPPAQEPTAGRNVERVEITGLRSRQSEEIMSHLKTRPGESYRQEQITADLQSILALGFFDRKETTVRVEEGSRGGVNVIFELVELPSK